MKSHKWNWHPLLACLLVLLGIFLLEQPSQATGNDSGPTVEANHATGHHDPVAPMLVGIVVILLAAKVGGHIFEVVGQPAVLGELVVGVLLGNLTLFGIQALDFLKMDYQAANTLHFQNPYHCAGVAIDMMARIGVILLLFQVGLETSITDLRKVGKSAFVVATLGVVMPLILGWGSGWYLLPERNWTVHMFLGATLCATSVGITARVLRDLGKTTSRESKIILGAAVIDDVLGLMVLALAQGVILGMNTDGSETSSFGFTAFLLVVTKACGFLFGALFLGQYIARPLFKVASLLHGGGLLVVTALTFCFALAWLADEVGLATIVGAFAAGLVLEKVHYRELASRNGKHDLEELIRPVADLFVPVFFVMIGFQVDLRTFANPSVIALAAVLTIAAVIGKQICSLGVLEKGLDRRSVGLGMIPRGEVGIIFASIGREMRIGEERLFDDGIYSALVIMVMFTTLITPPLLKWSLAKSSSQPVGGT